MKTQRFRVIRSDMLVWVEVEIPETMEDFTIFCSNWGKCPIWNCEINSEISRVCPKIVGIADLLNLPAWIPAWCKCKSESEEKIIEIIEENALKLVCK